MELDLFMNYTTKFDTFDDFAAKYNQIQEVVIPKDNKAAYRIPLYMRSLFQTLYD